MLGIETSCDETGLALYDDEKGLIAEVLHSQIDLHADYGGVVPELASRDHIRKIKPLTDNVLEQANVTLQDLNGVAYTAGPGLLGALLVGATYGRTLAWALDVPAVEVHHMEAHLLAPLIAANPTPSAVPISEPLADRPAPPLPFIAPPLPFIAPPLPFIALLVSGGHTQLVRVERLGVYEILGESVDDAVGEAFDKAAKMLGLGYPGGPALAAAARTGDPQRFRFPRPMTDRPGLDFSFSGLKTFTLNTVKQTILQTGPLTQQDTADIAIAFEIAATETLFIKCRRAVQETGITHLVMAGGVSANQRLREKLDQSLDAQVYFAPPALCTDNGAMIAYAGALRLLAGQAAPLAINTRARWPLTELAAIP